MATAKKNSAKAKKCAKPCDSGFKRREQHDERVLVAFEKMAEAAVTYANAQLVHANASRAAVDATLKVVSDFVAKTSKPPKTTKN